MIRPRPDTRHGHHNGGAKRTLDLDALVQERARLWREEPRGPARTAALNRVSIQMGQFARRSPYKEW